MYNNALYVYMQRVDCIALSVSIIHLYWREIQNFMFKELVFGLIIIIS